MKDTDDFLSASNILFDMDPPQEPQSSLHEASFDNKDDKSPSSACRSFVPEQSICEDSFLKDLYQD